MTGTINQPHPNDDVVADPEDFFGPEETKDEVGTEGEPPTGDPEMADLPEPDADPEEPEQPVVQDAEVAPAEAAAPSAEEVDDADAENADAESGNKREYIVLQEIVLDQEVLQELLKQVKGGVAPVVALVEIHRTQVTTQKAALASAWRLHGESWETPPRLAAVTASKLRVRGVRVKMREVTGVDFD